MILAAAFLILLALLAVRVPVSFALAVAGFFGLLFSAGPQVTIGIVSNTFFDTAASYIFLVVPMFVLMGEILAVSGIAEKVVVSCQRWLGHFRGGVAIACVAAATVMAAIIGSSTASAAVMSSAAYPPMQRLGYQPGFAVGVIAISGTLAVMIPPSVILILYGILTNESIGQLLIAGIVPGILTAVGYVITIQVCVRLKPSYAPQRERFELREATRSVRTIWPALLLIVAMLFSLYSGVATPTEVGALGAMGALLIAAGLLRTSSSKILKAFSNTAAVTSGLMLILIGALIFGYFITYSQLTQQTIQLVTDAELKAWQVLAIVLVIYIILGMFMDQIAILVLTTPLIYPVVSAVGIDGVWFGILMTKTAEIGFVTPPFGLNIFIASHVTGVPMRKCFLGVIPFLITEAVVLGLLIAFPSITLFLPNLMKP